MLVVQRVFRAKRTNLHEKYDYPLGRKTPMEVLGQDGGLEAVRQALKITLAKLDAWAG